MHLLAVLASASKTRVIWQDDMGALLTDEPTLGSIEHRPTLAGENTIGAAHDVLKHIRALLRFRVRLKQSLVSWRSSGLGT